MPQSNCVSQPWQLWIEVPLKSAWAAVKRFKSLQVEMEVLEAQLYVQRFFQIGSPQALQVYNSMGVSFNLPAWSVSILPDCKTVTFNTAMVAAHKQLSCKRRQSWRQLVLGVTVLPILVDF